MFLDTSNRMATRSARRRDRLWAGMLLALMFSAGLVAGAWLPHSRFNTSSGDTERMERDRLVEASRSRDAGIRQPAQVVRVIDGDTFEARVHLWQGLDITTHIRLRGVDAPELKARCFEESRMAQAARDALVALLNEGGVIVFIIGPDKYNGRVVADAATRTTPNVSAALIAAGHGRPYGGGRRAGWCSNE
jgi:micrococcal nuclease